MAGQTSGVLDVTDALKRRWRAFLLVALPLLGGVGWYVQSLPDAYDSTAVVAFSPRADADVGADLIRVVVPKYVVYVSSVATSRTVGARLGMDDEELLAAVDASVAPETANLTITVRLADPQRAADAANVLAQEAVSLSEFDEKLSGRTIVPALAEDEPASPPRMLLLAGGLLLALGAGLVVAVVVDRSRPRVGDALGLALATGHPTLGRVPSSRAARGDVAAALNDPAVGTAVRALRTQVEQQSRVESARVIAVTSPGPGDGKTTVACLLAASLARVDARVLLVDADLHRPRVGAALGIDPAKPGLPQVLLGKKSMEQVVLSTDHPGLSVVQTGVHPDAGDLLARRLGAFLLAARDTFDVVVVDCPPLLSTDDARTVALCSEATVVVVSAGSDLARARAATGALDGLGARVLGCVLNRTRKQRSDDLGSYGSYGSYGRR